jgi:hypothetical protein
VITLEKLKTSLQDTAVETEKNIKLQEAATPPAIPGTPGSPTNPSTPTVNGPLGALTADQINKLPGWQQAAYNGGPSSEFLNGLSSAIQPGASYSNASPAVKMAVSQIFAGNPLEYIKFGESGLNTLINSNLYSAEDIYDRYGSWPFGDTQSAEKLLTELWDKTSVPGGSGSGLDPKDAPATPQEQAESKADFEKAVQATLSVFKEIEDMGMVGKPGIPGLPSLPQPQNTVANLADLFDHALNNLGLKEVMDQLGITQPSDLKGLSFDLKNFLDHLSDTAPEGGFGQSTGLGGQVGTNATGNPADAAVGFAGGGWVWGKGTRTSDSIRYGSSRISSGEFIVNAEDAAANSDLIQAVNGTRSPINVKVTIPGYEHLCDLMQEMVSELSLTRKEVVEKLSEQNTLIKANTKAVNSATEYGAR